MKDAIKPGCQIQFLTQRTNAKDAIKSGCQIHFLTQQNLFSWMALFDGLVEQIF